MDCDRCGKYLKSNQIDNVRRHYDSDSCKRKTAAAAVNLQVLQPPDKRQRLLCTSATSASPEEPSTCNESFASDDSIASAEHNTFKLLCCGHIPDVPSPFVHNWTFASHGLQQLPFTFEQSGLRALDYESFAPWSVMRGGLT